MVRMDVKIMSDGQVIRPNDRHNEYVHPPESKLVIVENEVWKCMVTDTPLSYWSMDRIPSSKSSALLRRSAHPVPAFRSQEVLLTVSQGFKVCNSISVYTCSCNDLLPML